MVTYNTVILISWATFIIVWMVFAFRVKRDIRGGGVMGVWYRYFLMRFVVIALFVLTRTFLSCFLSKSIFTPPLALGWFAAILVVLGVAFAIWARVHLGTNWSPAPAVKEKHELVTSGPYVYVRHPIYTGILLATFGAALTGSIVGICMLLFASIIFFLRIIREEKIMLELFPDTYPVYQARTKKLIPFVW